MSKRNATVFVVDDEEFGAPVAGLAYRFRRSEGTNVPVGPATAGYRW